MQSSASLARYDIYLSFGVEYAIESMDEGKATLKALMVLVLSVSLLALIGIADALSVNLSVGHSQIDTGHIETIVANVAGGTPNSYSLKIVNASGSLIYFNSIDTTNNSVAFSWNVISIGRLYANVSVQSNSFANQIVSGTMPFTVEPGLTLNTTLKSSSITEGQEQDITANVAGGAAPFVFNYTIYNSNGSIVANAVYQSSLASNTFVFNQNSAFGVGNFVASVIVTDSSGEIAGAEIGYVVVGLAQNSSSSASILPVNAFITNVTVNEVGNNELLRSLFSEFHKGSSSAAHKVLGKTAKQSVISEMGVRGSFILPADLSGTFKSRFHGEVYAANITILYGNYKAATLNLVNISVVSNLSVGRIVSYASFVPKGASTPILISPNAVLSEITVKADAGIKNIFTNITFNNTHMQHLGGFNRPYYIAFQVNSTLNDSNVTSAIYKFSVSKAWINSIGINPDQVTLYKYVNTTWIPLPTYEVGSNATSYDFSALSNSLSTYVVSFNSGGVAGNANPESLTLPTGYRLYICGAGANYTFATSGTAFTWTQDVGAPSGAPVDGGENASIGHQSSNSCSAYTTGATNGGLAVAGVGVNATYYKLYSASASSSSSDSLSYTVATSNSFVVLVGAAGYYNFTTITIPSSCAVQKRISNADGYETAYVATCQNAASGAYTFSADSSGSGSSALAAYIFPPRNVILDDNPSTATITTNGNTYSNGQAMQVIGTNAITANPPSTGNWAFSLWSVSNTINLTVANVLDPSTTLTVTGNGTITATWKNETTAFVETGLPSPFSWNVIYNGVLESSSTNIISFVNSPGTYSFTVSNQIINGNKYVPVPSSGSASAGNTIDINFTLEGKPALLVSKNPEPYGSTDSVTVNAVPSSDYVELNISGGIFGSSNIVSGPSKGSLLYTFPVVSTGVYTLNALDTNTLESTVANLTVSKATPAISLPNFPSSFFYNGSTATVTANIVTYNNQLPLNLYVNNVLVATTATQTSVQVGPSTGTYVITANTLGNNNYTSASITKSFSIEAPPPKTIANYASNAGTSTTSPLTVSTPGTYKLYLCAGGAGNGAVTYTSGTVDQYSTSDYSYIGHQAVNGCTETTSNPDLAEAIFGINDTTYTLQKSNGTSSASLTFNVAEPGSLVAIMISAGYYGFSGQPTIPSGCKELQRVTGGDGFESAYVAVCPSLAAGSYTASVTLSGTGGAEIGAYIFPPNYVHLNDIPPTASIVANGTTYPNGSKIILLGETSANAIAPASSNFIFNRWLASNSNITISNAISQNTIISATGNGTITATWNGISKFVESGLPSATTWNVIYDGILNSSPTNTISFSTSPGNFSFTVANQVSNGITYIPSPSAGYLSAGNITDITFTPVKVCTVSLAPNSVNFGNMYAGSNIATTNAVTDTNTGNANAYILVYGGNWIGPKSFGVSNTTWAASSGVPFISANRLSALATNTLILVPESSSNSIYFGLGIPGGAPSGPYTQNIIIENSC